MRRALPLTVLVALAVLGCHGDIRFDDLASATTCSQDPDCLLPALHCDSGRCVSCVTDAHCTTPGFPRCDTALHRCFPCGLASDCPAGEGCHLRHCAVACSTSAACPASTPKCDDSWCGQCDDGVGCAGSAAGPVCVNHLCAGCKLDTDCPLATPRCDPVGQTCVQCQLNVDCSGTTPLCDPAAGRCVAMP